MYICRSTTTYYNRQEKNTQLYLARASNKRLYNKKRKTSISYKKRRYELKSSVAKQVNI